VELSALKLEKLIQFHDEACELFFKQKIEPESEQMPALWVAISDNHRNNMCLWAEEDLARRKSVPAEEIASNKRAIDGFNQSRNDAIERIDDILTQLIFSSLGMGRLNSETPGSIIDRLSISSLKLYHMTFQASRLDVDASHRENCKAKAERIAEQRSDLCACLSELLNDCVNGKAHFKIYRQFKMYNDANLNMALVRETNTTTVAAKA
jgi:hypothetical protein